MRIYQDCSQECFQILYLKAKIIMSPISISITFSVGMKREAARFGTPELSYSMETKESQSDKMFVLKQGPDRLDQDNPIYYDQLDFHSAQHQYHISHS